MYCEGYFMPITKGGDENQQMIANNGNGIIPVKNLLRII